MAAIFISYRRSDTKHPTRRIYDRLQASFPGEVFMDVDSIPIGADFRKVIDEKLTRCRVALVMIGPGWVGASEPDGTRRLANPADFVRIELEAALSRNIPLVPILLDGATVPRSEDLPETLRRICTFHAAAIGDDPHFHDDVTRLIRGIGRLIDSGVGESGDPQAGDQAILALPGDLPMTFAWCPPGTFQMGSTQGESDESPVHRVTLTRGFYTGLFPVTQAQWHTVMGTDPSYFKSGPTCPVEHVSWNDAQAFSQTLTRCLKPRRVVRLPTEAEWEYACRAGAATRYHNGDAEEGLTSVGWFRGNSGLKPRPVGELAANAWGLHDLHGNVWEWCSDNKRVYSTADQTDPEARLNEEGRILRGGSCLNSARSCRASTRRKAGAAYRDDYVGFRICFHPS